MCFLLKLSLKSILSAFIYTFSKWLWQTNEREERVGLIHEVALSQNKHRTTRLPPTWCHVRAISGAWLYLLPASNALPDDR